MAPAWFSHGGPDVGRVTASGLLHRGNVSGFNLKVGWTPVRKLLWCCSGVQPSVGIGIALACCGWRHMVNTGPPSPLLLALPAAGAFQCVVNEDLCSPSFPGGRKKSRRANHPSVRLLGQRRTSAFGKEEGRVCVISSCQAVLCELLSTSEGEACD